MVLCGISTSFPVLFPTERKVAHALLTRPPLEHLPKYLSPLDLHVLGTPPAFVLSQDQTLAFNPFYLYRCLHQQDANSFGITVSCLRYSCSVSFSRFSAHRLACASRASLFILARPKTFVNAFLQLFSLFFSPFSFCERFSPKAKRPFRFWAKLRSRFPKDHSAFQRSFSAVNAGAKCSVSAESRSGGRAAGSRCSATRAQL